MAELRRGVDQAIIFSLAISPSNNLLAVTSDKSTLHVFDIPHPHNGPYSNQQASSSDEGLNKKWGILGKIPLLPRMFSDVYSFTNAHFEMGDEGPDSTPPVGSVLVRPLKGVIGWSDNTTILVLSSGTEGRWEKFVLRDGEEGKRFCIKKGWKKYLGGGS